MKYNIRGDKMVVTDAIKNYTVEKLDRLNKYFNDEDMTANVLTKIRGNKQIVEVTIPTDKFILRSEESNDDLYAAIDLAIDKLESQMRKYKSKLMSKSRIEIVYDDEVIDDEPLTDVVKRKKVYLKPMDEEEAVLQMEFLGHTFFIYRDINSEKVNVLYKRYDGTYGVIETN